jgi:hypothetical protein
VVSAISAVLLVEKKSLKNYSERTYEASAVLDKFFDPGHYVKHDPTLPVKGRFFGIEGVATLNGSCPSTMTTALKSFMTLTT